MFSSLRHVALRSRVGQVGVKRSPNRVLRRFMGSDMPVPQSQNAPMWVGHDPAVVTEGWEGSLYMYYALAVALQLAIITVAPETSIESWARPEAEARLALKEKGFTDFKFGTHYQDLLNDERSEGWTKFNERSMNPEEDDDDDDEDDDEDDDDEDEDED